jgi:hypothetical protein
MEMTMQYTLERFFDTTGVILSGLADGLISFKATVVSCAWAIKLIAVLTVFAFFKMA